MKVRFFLGPPKRNTMDRTDEITKMLRDLERAWLSRQDWRLGQLIENATGREANGEHHCIFYIEDDELIEKIKHATQETVQGTKR